MTCTAFLYLTNSCLLRLNLRNRLFMFFFERKPHNILKSTYNMRLSYTEITYNTGPLRSCVTSFTGAEKSTPIQ